MHGLCALYIRDNKIIIIEYVELFNSLITCIAEESLLLSES